MESNILQTGNKSISLYHLEKVKNNLKTKNRKYKQTSTKCSLSRKKTNIMRLNIFNENTINSKSYK